VDQPFFQRLSGQLRDNEAVLLLIKHQGRARYVIVKP
jgi:hypothetical protein